MAARLSGLFLALGLAARAEDCADGGPFKCTDDAGCPSPEVSCAQLAALKQCGSRFDQIFDRPPATAHPRVSEACPVACSSCGSGGPAAGAGPSRTTAGRVAPPRASSGTRSSTRSLKITAPAGSHGGHLLLVETAGSVIKVDVPAGVRAGEAFDVPVLAELWSERPVARLALDGGPVASGDGYKSPARKPKQARLAGAGRGGQSFSAPGLVGGSGGGRCRRAKAAERAEGGADAKVGGAAKEERVEGRGQARTSRRARAPGAAGGARGGRASAVVDPAEGAGGARPSTAEPAAAAAASPVHGLPTVKLRALLERAGLETQGSREEVAARAEAAAARGELALPTEKQRDKTRRVATRTGRAAKRAPREEL